MSDDKIVYHVDHDDLFCKFCGKECKNKNSLAQHEIRCKDNPNRLQKPCNIPRSACGWAKGLTKDTDSRVARGWTSTKKYYETHSGSFLGKHHSEKTKAMMSLRALENNYESRFGPHKSYEYKGIRFISSYELRVAESLDENYIEWTRPSRLPYVDDNGKHHHYTADFYLPYYDVYLDPKNDFLISNVNPVMGYTDSQKIQWVMQQNNVKVIVLDKDHLEWDKIRLLL